jgi:hypothetical protein
VQFADVAGRDEMGAVGEDHVSTVLRKVLNLSSSGSNSDGM